MPQPLTDRRILLGVTGGIAAYKACDLVRRLREQGADVRVAMTTHATELVRPLTFQALSDHPVRVELFSPVEEEAIGHISLADWAEAAVIAPATANFVAKVAHGLADDFLSTVVLATTAPVLVCPSMNVHMYENAVYQDNESRVRALDRVQVLTPASGELACGYAGRGRLPAVGEIVAAVAELLGPQDLAGVRVLVTAGPTREALDAVRFLSNRSTGKMGFAVAAAAAARGATVTLVHGPVSLAAPPGVTAVPVSSAAEMAAAVTDRFAEQDAVIKVAAVADYRPAEVIAGKRKKGDDTWTLELERTEDILAGLAADKGDRVLVGFAAEAERVAEHAAEKLVRKGLDLIVANDITRADAGFGADTNAATIIGADGQREEVDLVDKRVLAHRVLDRVVGILGSRT